jgi:hypothetical protein
MNHKFSMSETSSLVKTSRNPDGDDENPSWINLKTLKDAIRLTSNIIHYEE